MKTRKTKDLEKVLSTIQDEDTLHQYLRDIKNINETTFYEYYASQTKNYEKSELVQDSCIERSYCYHILNGTKKPSRDKILCLCIAAKFDSEQTKRALEIANEGILYAKSSRDTLIQYAINQKLSVIETNILLEEHQEKVLDI